MPPRNRKLATADVATPETPRPVAPSASQVVVIARSPIAEMIDGAIRHFAPGERFTLPESRAVELGPLVDRVASH